KKIFGYAPPINLQNKMSALALAFDTHGFFEIFKNLNLIEFELKTKKNIEKTEFLLASLLKFQRILADMQKNKSKY
ncbi:MAG: hypothetical protein J6T36_01330, partial [Campylobacter sp.]|nr:hypothetical protein [Campylobacter sp.]